ncbi:MAG: hypothetical protein ABL891_18265 [Burkholderiales bacterium]
MIFNSQSGLIQKSAGRSREGDWAQWYFEHLRIMATVPGVFSAQRFTTTHPGHPPSLAMYGVASADVFKGEYYQSVRGMGEWLPLIDKQWYRRNLFDGLNVAPDVTDEQILLVADRDAPDVALAALPFVWLKVVGIDRSTPYRGIAVLNKSAAQALPETVAIYAPASQRYINMKEDNKK